MIVAAIEALNQPMEFSLPEGKDHGGGIEGQQEDYAENCQDAL